MQTLKIVMGPPASGKTWFIQNRLAAEDPGATVIDAYSYQRELQEKGPKPLGFAFQVLYEANKRILDDILSALQRGESVIVEHTLYKRKRRVAYIDSIQGALPNAHVIIEFYFMCPSEEQWKCRLDKRELPWAPHKRILDEIELPHPDEGIDSVFLVTDDGISRYDPPPLASGVIDQARKELREEAERICQENEEKRKRKELIDTMNTRPFWHYCEVCGRKEFLTADEAFESGWDYPPRIGHWGLLGPRTCGSCLIVNTLFWKITTGGGLPIVCEGDLTPEELVTWRRIKGEPKSLLE